MHGCVPLLIGLSADDARAHLPLATQLEYSRFSGQLSRAAFSKDPAYAVSALVHKLTPRLGAMRQALADVRHRLMRAEAGGVTAMLLRSAEGMAFAPPSSSATG